MTKRDFILIADAIRTVSVDEITHDARYAVAVRFADALANTNARFDRARFLTAATTVDTHDGE